jgi:hypothetical protein
MDGKIKEIEGRLQTGSAVNPAFISSNPKLQFQTLQTDSVFRANPTTNEERLETISFDNVVKI